MNDRPINLNRARKERDREREKTRADENAIIHGRTKSERMAEAMRSEKARAHLDAHRFSDED
ncbi:DUF4169 family protein [Palleronia sp. LCG004]|uniref:DUF4169 family protein n=1 Tax=Palleronia sp. LCG004 TaxID=3079304 RepID=UPI002942A37E|nr:DUF4169 family protein [Palleronia sp. LCG004]WOI55094.1 DUF4169 family protein [Palleronia sp. LCG004]